jgi:hypothetical protein
MTGQQATCPHCKEIKPLAFLTRSTDGRQWVNPACAPCGMAMNEDDVWTFYAGGTTNENCTR